MAMEIKKAQTRIPDKAAAEIQKILRKNLWISTNQMDSILKKHGVKGRSVALQRSYRLRLGQQYLAGFLDESGKREILAAGGVHADGMEYVVVDACNNARQLSTIRKKLQNQSMGLDRSADKVDKRLGFFGRVARWGAGKEQKNGEN